MVSCAAAPLLADRHSTERPLVLPIYLSSPAFNLAAMTSYTNFCFLYHIRASAFLSEHGSLRDGLAETFYYYSQNLPTVALLLPRAGLSLALLLAFWNPQPEVLALADAGISPRDGTFFRRSDQTLTDYARGVLIANAAWSAWRILVLFVSWSVRVCVILSPIAYDIIIGSGYGFSVVRVVPASADRVIAGKRRMGKRSIQSPRIRSTRVTLYHGLGAKVPSFASSMLMSSA